MCGTLCRTRRLIRGCVPRLVYLTDGYVIQLTCIYGFCDRLCRGHFSMVVQILASLCGCDSEFLWASMSVEIMYFRACGCMCSLYHQERLKVSLKLKTTDLDITGLSC